jgi:hypothetical protein
MPETFSSRKDLMKKAIGMGLFTGPTEADLNGDTHTRQNPAAPHSGHTDSNDYLKELEEDEDEQIHARWLTWKEAESKKRLAWAILVRHS